MPEKKDQGYNIEPGQEWKVDLFRPEDAEGVKNLFLSVYGKGYPIKTFIEPELLIQANRSGRIISSVARTLKGDIIGHNSLFNSAPYKGIYESGAGLVHKNYRGGKGIFTKMFIHGLEVGVKKFNIELVYGEPVCNHIFSQKLVYSHGFVSMAIEIDLMPSEAYGKEKTSKGRVSTTLNFKTFIPKRHKVYMPEAYIKNANFLYSSFDDKRDIIISNQSPPYNSKTRVEVQFFDFANVVRVAIWEIGKEFEDIIIGVEDEFLPKGATIIQVWCNLGSPWVGWARQILKKRNYFFGGILPRWFDSDGLFMQKLFHEPHWDSIILHYERDKKIFSMVKNSYAE